MTSPSTQSTIGHPVLVVPTAAVAISLPHDHTNETHLLPSREYHALSGEQDVLHYDIPHHESSGSIQDTTLASEINAGAMEVPTIAKVRVRLGSPEPLEFFVVEDNEGFV